MNVVCVGDIFVTPEMMEQGAKPYIKPGDTLKILFWGGKNRAEMRSMVKAVESMQRDVLPIPDELPSLIQDCDILMVHLCPVTRSLLSKARHLKAILSCRGGSENVDVAAASEKGIVVTTYPAHNANAVAEYTIGLMLCETRNIARSDHALRNGVWREKYPNTETTIREMKDLTIGLIGFGSVGRLVADRLSVFGCKIIVHDPFIDERAYDFIKYKFVDLKTLLQNSDVVSLHARGTRPILGLDELKLMKPTAYLINTARSVLIDQAALAVALKSHLLQGLAVDVFESEPDIPKFYREYDNVTITNHRGGDTINSYLDAPTFAIRNYMKFLSGERLKFWINKEKLVR